MAGQRLPLPYAHGVPIVYARSSSHRGSFRGRDSALYARQPATLQGKAHQAEFEAGVVTFSETLVLFVKQMEGFRSVAYHDVAGRLTVGYGEAEGVVPGQVVSEQEADLMLRGTLSEVAEQVRKAVTVDLTQGQFDALCDFAFNLGIG